MQNTFHRFPTRAAFLAACDAAGWPRDHLGNPTPPPSVSLDVIGPYAPPPTVVDGVMVPAEWDGRWHVNALWPADDAIPAEWAAAEIVPESPMRMFAARDLPATLARFKATYDALRTRKSDDPKLVARREGGADARQ